MHPADYVAELVNEAACLERKLAEVRRKIAAFIEFAGRVDSDGML